MGHEKKRRNRNHEKKLFAIALTALLLGLCFSAQAQRIPRVGIVFMGGRDQPHLESFKQGIREMVTQKARTYFLNTAMPKAIKIACRISPPIW